MAYDIESGTGMGVTASIGRRLNVFDLVETAAPEAPSGYAVVHKIGATAWFKSYASSHGSATLKKAHVDNPAYRDAIRRGLISAENQSLEIVRLAKNADLIAMANTGFELQETLRNLWSRRLYREDDWVDLLNVLQIVLAQEQFEKFTEMQCVAIHKVIAEHLALGAVDEDDLSRSIRMLHDAGFDPWKAISGNKMDDDEDNGE